MSRLRNRIRKADYFSDGELLRWPRDKRSTYSGLWALAEDSGCLTDDCFEWKMSLWPSPLDADITVETLEQWRDEFIAAGKLIPYESDGKRYLFIRTFHQHERPTNPQRPDLPLPPWVSADAAEGRAKDGKKWSRCSFTVSTDLMPPQRSVSTESVQSGIHRGFRSPVLSRPVPSVTDQSLNPLQTAEAVSGVDEDFEAWWVAYNRTGTKARTRDLYVWWRRHEHIPADGLLAAASAYRSHCERTDCKMKYGETFLAKPRKDKSPIWPEWAEGEDHGSMDVAGDDELASVLRAGALTYGSDNGGRSAVCESDQPTRLAGRRAHDRIGVSAQRLGQAN